MTCQLGQGFGQRIHDWHLLGPTPPMAFAQPHVRWVCDCGTVKDKMVGQ